MSSHQVTPQNRIVLRRVFKFTDRRPHIYFYLLSRSFSNQNVMLTPHVIFNVTRKLVPSNSDICVGHNPSKCNYSDLRCASSDIDDHIAHRFLNIDADSNCSGHRFMNEIDILASCMLCRILYSAFLYICDPRRDAYDHSVRGCKPRLFILIDHFNHPFNHLLSRLKIGNDSIP